MGMFFNLVTTLTPEQVYKLFNLNSGQFRLGSNLKIFNIMNNSLKNSTPFNVKSGFYAILRSEGETIYYAPKPIVGEEAKVKVWVEPEITIVTEVIGVYDAGSRVNLFQKEFVKAGCPPGWSVVILEVVESRDKFVSKVKEILYTRLLRVGDMHMGCLIRFFKANGMSTREANALFLKEMEVIITRPMRMFDDLEMDEEVSRELEICQELTIEEARYASLTRNERVHSQQPFTFYSGAEKYPVFYKGEIEYVSGLQSNDTFQIARAR